MLGKILLQARKSMNGGLRTSWYREVVRLRILDTKPIVGTSDFSCEVHVYTSEADWLNLIWALKTLYYFSKRKWALTIHLDGSLLPTSIQTLRKHFPDARLIDKAKADNTVLPGLLAFPNCHHFRSTNLLAPKVFDFFHYLKSDKMILLDSDVLFFSEPKDLVEKVENPAYRLNCFNADISSAYTVTPEVVGEKLGFGIMPRINSGLAIIHRQSFVLSDIEQYLSLPGIYSHFWRIEQTIYALLSSRFGAELLPQPYDVRLGSDKGLSVCRHYVGEIRHLLYGEGIRHLSRNSPLLQPKKANG